MRITPNIFENTATAFALKSDFELQKAKTLFSLVGSPLLVNMGSTAANLALGLHLPVSFLFRHTIYNHFCGGETFDECKKTIENLAKSKVGVLLNYGVELKETEADFDTTVAKNMEAIAFAAENRSVKALCIKITGFGRFGLFEKMQSGVALSAKEKAELKRVKQRLEQMCAAAAEWRVALYVDAEESWIQDPLDSLVEEMMIKYNHDFCTVYNTFQIYRWDRLDYLKAQTQKAISGNYLLGAKLVRGAYMEKERERAADMGYRSPIHENKEAVDLDFNAAVAWCFDHLSQMSVCVASQSEASNLLAIEMLQSKSGADRAKVLFSQLYGMGDNITFNLAESGFQATKYLPYGPVKDVVPYLIRRAQENTSVAGQTGRELSLIQRELARRKKKS